MNAQDDDHFGRHPKLWSVTAVRWVLDNPRDYPSGLLFPSEAKDPTAEFEMTEELESVDAPDLDHAIAAAHELLEKHKEHVGEFALEIYVNAPQLPHADQERLGIRDYKVTPEARKQARAIGLRGRDLEARIARMVRHSVPYEHEIANVRFRGVILRVEDDVVTWISLLDSPRRRRRKTK